jgi:hypothetical protein
MRPTNRFAGFQTHPKVLYVYTLCITNRNMKNLYIVKIENNAADRQETSLARLLNFKSYYYIQDSDH